jgi:hypothetical protein
LYCIQRWLSVRDCAKLTLAWCQVIFRQNRKEKELFWSLEDPRWRLLAFLRPWHSRRSGVLSALLSCFELNLKTNKQKWRHHTVYHLQIQLALLSETISLIMMVTVICHIFNITVWYFLYSYWYIKYWWPVRIKKALKAYAKANRNKMFNW